MPWIGEVPSLAANTAPSALFRWPPRMARPLRAHASQCSALSLRWLLSCGLQQPSSPRTPAPRLRVYLALPQFPLLDLETPGRNLGQSQGSSLFPICKGAIRNSLTPARGSTINSALTLSTESATGSGLRPTDHLPADASRKPRAHPCSDPPVTDPRLPRPSSGSINLLERLTELREAFSLLHDQFIIKRWNSEVARWEETHRTRHWGRGMDARPSPHVYVATSPEALPARPCGFLRGLHYVGMIDSLIDDW